MPYYSGNLDGPLPITIDLTPESNSMAFLTVSGSVWSAATSVQIGIEVAWEGTALGAATIFSNGPSTHRAVVPKTFALALDKPWDPNGDPPTYTLTLSPMNADTISDRNDSYHIVLAS